MNPYNERKWHRVERETRFSLGKCPECGMMYVLDEDERGNGKCVKCTETYVSHVCYLKFMNNEVIRK